MLPSELRLISLKHCYIQLPESFTRDVEKLKPGAVISIKSVQNDTELLVTWDGFRSLGNFAQLDLNFGQANKFTNGELIVLSHMENLTLPECSTCRVELVDSSDYTILSQHLEANLLDTCKLVFRGLVIPINLSQHVQVLVKVVDLQPDEGDGGLLNKSTEMQFQHNLENIPDIEKPEVDIPVLNPIPFVSRSLGIEGKSIFYLGSMLICGERGSGKTYRLKNIIHDYRKYHGQYFDCQQLRGKRPETVKKQFNELLTIALDNQPSILGLDDIDSFVGIESRHQEDEKGQDAIYKRRLVDALCQLFKQLERSEHIKSRRVAIIATCRSLSSLDESISKPKGRQYFNKIVTIGSPNLQERITILRTITSEQRQLHCDIDDKTFETLAKKCSSFMPLDLRRLVERAIISACSRSLQEFNSDPIGIKEDDFSRAFDGYTPFNLRCVVLQPKTGRTFDNVGGMKKIRDTLMKTILLQVKYPKLFKKCPMRPQTSILLHGPSGCGKTLIAEALTNEECINSICVRGPELLSKYIGASEGSVRDLFKRAELAKPCVIFFDEFESLVPKRGADSTGVTDRVVNQFLTLMDGVEKLSEQVFIVAASSRPEMIDPAILRPGRLDRHIYCPPPDRDDRLDIFRVLSKDIIIEDCDAHLAGWAEKLDGFTGADIQSLLYSAQLKALHDLIGPSDFSKPRTNKEVAQNLEIIVSQLHLEQSFDEMKLDAARLKNPSKNYPNINGLDKVNVRVGSRATLT